MGEDLHSLKENFKILEERLLECQANLKVYEEMFKSLLAALFTKVSVHSKANAIRGTYSHGSQDRPGVWWR